MNNSEPDSRRELQDALLEMRLAGLYALARRSGYEVPPIDEIRNAASNTRRDGDLYKVILLRSRAAAGIPPGESVGLRGLVKWIRAFFG